MVFIFQSGPGGKTCESDREPGAILAGGEPISHHKKSKSVRSDRYRMKPVRAPMLGQNCNNK
jgi:hypothetical protein